MKNKIILTFALGVILLLIINVNYAFGYSINYKRSSNKIVDLIKYPELTFFGPNWYTKPANYAQLVSWYQTLESTYPNYLEVFKANELYDTGTATGGYDLYYIRITNESLGLNKPEVLFLGDPHGDETVGTVGLYWFTDWLMRMAFTDETNQEFTKDYLQWIIDNREIYLEVSHNPYGFDHGPQRYDGNGWDLNREADMDGPGSPTGGIWASVNGKTLRAFIDNHLIRTACDFHGGARLLLYPWGSNHASVYGTSPITGHTYGYAPPDFYFFDVSSLRLGNYMGDYGGNLDDNSIGTIPDTVGYVVNGGISPWAYGADIEKNPVEDPFVQDEIWGNYPGAGILWLSPEMSLIKNPSESNFGNDTVHYYGAEVRRFVLHQTDLAQPYVKWHPGTIENNTEIEPGNSVPFKWKVNGSLVVDHTYIQWGTDPDPINTFDHTTSDKDEHAGDYYGGTGWDNAESGTTNGITYNDNIYITEPGDYYFVVKAQVDQVYKTVLHPEIYGNNPYLRMVKERTNDDYYEMLEGSDGTEEIFGQTWWYSSIIHVSVINGPPNKPNKPSGPSNGKPGQNYTYSTKTFDPNYDDVYFKWDWGDGTVSDWEGPYATAETAESNHIWNKAGTYLIKVKAKDSFEDESDWSDPLSVTMPKNKISSQFLQRIIEKIQHMSPILLNLIKI
jgi:hypothetical protein